MTFCNLRCLEQEVRDFLEILWKSGCGVFVTHRAFRDSVESGRFTSIWKQSEAVPDGRNAPSGSQAGLRKLLASDWGSLGEPRAQGMGCAGDSAACTWWELLNVSLDGVDE